MRIPLDRLIDGMVQALTTHVLPSVSDRFARGQVWSVVDLLNNLRERIDWKAALLDDETRSAEAVLAEITTRLRDAGHDNLVASLPIVPADGPATERVSAARAALVAVLERLGDLPASIADPARAAIGTHLAMNAMRDLQTFKLSLLNEISKG